MLICSLKLVVDEGPTNERVPFVWFWPDGRIRSRYDARRRDRERMPIHPTLFDVDESFESGRPFN